MISDFDQFAFTVWIIELMHVHVLLSRLCSKYNVIVGVRKLLINFFHL